MSLQSKIDQLDTLFSNINIDSKDLELEILKEEKKRLEELYARHKDDENRRQYFLTAISEIIDKLNAIKKKTSLLPQIGKRSRTPILRERIENENEERLPDIKKRFLRSSNGGKTYRIQKKSKKTRKNTRKKNHKKN